MASRSSIINPRNKDLILDFDCQCSPDDIQFRQRPLHFFIITRNGRPVYCRFGNLIKCATFTATLSTILGKWRLFQPGEDVGYPFAISLQGKKFYILERQQLLLVAFTTLAFQNHVIYSAMDFAYSQFISIVSTRVHQTLRGNSSFDPSTMISKSRELIDHAFEQARCSPAHIFGCLPVLRLPEATRSSILNIFKEVKESDIIFCCLMTLTEIIQVYKVKEVQLHNQDLFLLFNILHVRKSLESGQNWFPICLPGIAGQGNLQCYLSPVQSEKLRLFFLAVTDSSETEMFYYIRSVQKVVTSKLLNPSLKLIQPLIQAVSALPNQISIGEQVIDDEHLQTVTILVQHMRLKQIVGNTYYSFGANRNQGELEICLNRWTRLAEYCAEDKEKMCFEQGYGLFSLQQCVVYIACDPSTSIFEMKGLCKRIALQLKQQKSSLFMNRIV